MNRFAKFSTVLLLMVLGLIAPRAEAQHVLYPSHFDLSEITLLDGPFKRAQELNYKTLLEYDVDRLLTPLIRQAGLSQTNDEHNRYYNWENEHPAFENWAWNPSLAMDGHITGHYLSALAISYSSCHDAAMRTKLKQRMDYMVDVMTDCQNAYSNNKQGLRGFIGGIPDNEIWKTLYSGDYRVYNQRGIWVPFYCEHKLMAGLRDAYVYGGNEKAKTAFKGMCDWVIDVVKNFREDIMEMQILQWEPGGINEVLADAYFIFGEGKYFKAAEKYSHQIMIENMVRDDRHDFLDQKNSNEATAKFVGFARINNVKSDERYQKASRLFWNDVVTNRTTAIGGAGVANYFQPANKLSRYISESDGPDACTSYNLLKLSEMLFDDSHQTRYVDFYERVMLNHILSNQDPETGGYVFYTATRPNSYRIYSKANEAMWCCVGTGMESHSKYGQFIYSYAKDTLFVNLFLASEVNSEKVGLRQETQFPYGQSSKITITKPGNYVIAVRRPEWTNASFNVLVNGKAPKKFVPSREDARSYYVSCGKGWKAGDVIEVTYPMSLSFEECPRVPTYIALKYGPTVLSGVTERSSQGKPFFNEYAGEGKRDHSNSARQKPQSLALAPMIISERGQVPSRIKVEDAKNLVFNVDASASGSAYGLVEMRPFFDTQHGKYTIYWNQQTETAWLRNPLYLRELRNNTLEGISLDLVDVGNEQSENSHKISISATGSCGTLNEQTFRDCQPNQWFEYGFDCTKFADEIAKSDSITLLLHLSLSDRNRGGTILVDGKPVYKLSIPSSSKGSGKDKVYDIPVNISSSHFKGKMVARIKFQAPGNAFFPRLYTARLMKYDAKVLSGYK